MKTCNAHLLTPMIRDLKMAIKDDPNSTAKASVQLDVLLQSVNDAIGELRTEVAAGGISANAVVYHLGRIKSAIQEGQDE